MRIDWRDIAYSLAALAIFMLFVATVIYLTSSLVAGLMVSLDTVEVSP